MKLFPVVAILLLASAVYAERYGGGGPGPADPWSADIPPQGTGERTVVPTSVWMKCTVDVEVSSSSNPGIGTEEWWKKQYSIMDFIFQRCTTAGTDNTFEISPQNQILPLPKGQPVNFELSEPDKTPWAFIPLYDQDLQNLPNRYGGSTWGQLTCHKPWTTAFIDLKGCTIVHGNTIAAATKAREQAMAMYGETPVAGPTQPGKAGEPTTPMLKNVVLSTPMAANPTELPGAKGSAAATPATGAAEGKPAAASTEKTTAPAKFLR